MSQTIPKIPPRKRTSCLSCLVQVGGALLLAVGVMLVVSAITTPWGFYLGGKFHIIPNWTGYGTLHSSIARDFVIFLDMDPKSSRQGPYLKGNGFVCTPRNEILKLRLYGSVPGNPPLNMNGQPIHIDIYRFSNFSGDRSPQLEFEGNWRNPVIVANDDGSISRAFKPDGSLYPGTKRPAKSEIVPITFQEGSKSDFDAACNKIQHH